MCTVNITNSMDCILTISPRFPWVSCCGKTQQAFFFGFAIFRGQNTYVQPTTFRGFGCMQGFSFRRIKPRKGS